MQLPLYTCVQKVQDYVGLKDIGNKKIVVSFERTFNIIYKILLQIFRNKLNSCNILTETNEMAAILD
jgi:hypothetical protein